MRKNLSLIKIIIITILLFIISDLLIGNYIYKKFIRINFLDINTSFAIRDEIYDHRFSSSYKGLAGWGNIRYTFCTDANGFKSSCKDQFSNLKEFDLGFIGDSFTESVGTNFENSFVGKISSSLNDKKIANLAIASYSPSIYYAKINFLLSQGYKFKEIIVFVDMSDIVDDTVCYKLQNKIVKRRDTFSGCFQQKFNFKYKVKEFFKKRFRLSFALYNLVKDKLIELELLHYKVPAIQTNNSRSDWTYNYKPENYNNFSYKEASSIIIANMEKLAILLKQNDIDLSVAVYPWPGTLKYDTENNNQLKLWKEFCKSNCKNFYNFMKPFFQLLEKNSFSNVYEKVYIKSDRHFNEEGNKIIADNFLKLYKDQ